MNFKSIIDYLKAPLIVHQLHRVIKSCNVEMEKIEDGTAPLPAGMVEPTEIFSDILEERHEYLSDFASRLRFILQYPTRRMQV